MEENEVLNDRLAILADMIENPFDTGTLAMVDAMRDVLAALAPLIGENPDVARILDIGEGDPF